VRVPYAREEVSIPRGVDIKVEKCGPYDYAITVRGPLGEIRKVIRNTPIVMSLTDSTVVLELYGARKREYAQLGAIKGLLKNMVLGVTRGWRYRLAIVYTHFPTIVKVEGGNLVIENFLGRKGKITLKIPDGIKVEASKEEVVIEGIDREEVSRFAAMVELATTLRGDRRPSPHGREGGPGVLDGIYLYRIEHLTPSP